jgi:transposase
MSGLLSNRCCQISRAANLGWTTVASSTASFWILRSGAAWRDLPGIFGPYTYCYNRFVRWRRAGAWGRIMNALAITHDAPVQMIDTSIVRVHQHAACITRNRSMGRSRGGLTSKIHAVVDTNGLPVRLALTAGQTHDNRLAGQLIFNKIKHCRRVAKRYDKLAANYLAFIQLASIRLWLRVNEYTPSDGARIYSEQG